VAFNYFGSREEPRRGVAIIDAHSGQLLRRFALDNDDPSEAHVGYRPMSWTPDSRALLFLRDSNGRSDLWQQPLDGSAPEQVTKFNPGRIFSFALSRDGKRVALAKGAVVSDVVLVKGYN
jgi:Tol biopolymer transport system component